MKNLLLFQIKTGVLLIKNREKNLAFAKSQGDKNKEGGHCVILQDPTKQGYYRNTSM